MPGPIEQRRHGARVHFHIVRPRVRDTLPEELVQRRRVPRELHARIERGPHAEPEDPEPHLLVGRCGNGAGRRAARRPAATRLIEQVDRIAATEEDGLEALTSIGGRFPRLRGLTVAVPEDEGQAAGVHRHLIENVRMVAMQRLALWVGCWGERALRDRVEGAGRGDHRPTDSEAALR
jgi:hypothetical protein